MSINLSTYDYFRHHSSEIKICKNIGDDLPDLVSIVLKLSPISEVGDGVVVFKPQQCLMWASAINTAIIDLHNWIQSISMTKLALLIKLLFQNKKDTLNKNDNTQTSQFWKILQ